MNSMVAHLHNVLAAHASGTPAHEFAKAKLSAVVGDIAAASASLARLLREHDAQLADDDFIFTNVLHIALLTYQLDLASRALNRRYATGSWFSVVYEQRRPQWLTVVTWRVAGRSSAVFSISRDLPTSDRFDFVINRWIRVLPICAAYLHELEAETGELQFNMEDHGVTPGLAFCDARPEYFLIPDPPYLLSLGYQHVRDHFKNNPVEWSKRIPVAFWRGSTTGRMTDRILGWRSLPRVRLCELARAHRDLIDAGLTQIVQMPDERTRAEAEGAGLMADFVPTTEFNRFRYQIDIDGNTNSWPGLFQKLLTGSPVLKVNSPGGYRQWYYDRLLPWLNYIPVATDMSDLVDKIAWLKAHDDAARQIGERGRILAESLNYGTEVRRAATTVAAALRYFSRLPELALRFGASGAGNTYLQDGWAAPEADGMPVLGQQGRMVLPPFIAIDDFVLEIELSPVDAPGIPPRQRVIIVDNGEILAQAELTSRDTLRCLLPRQTFAKSAELSLTMLCPDACRVASAERPLDAATLSVVLHRLTVIPAGIYASCDAAVPVVTTALAACGPKRHPMYELYGRDLQLAPNAVLQSVITNHGTMVFANLATGEVRHGDRNLAPRNVFFAMHSGQGHLLHVALDGRRFGIQVFPDTAPPSEVTAQAFDIIAVDSAARGALALRHGGLLLCAEADGRVTLSRQRLGPWETFALEVPPAPRVMPDVRRRAVVRATARSDRALPLTFFPEARIVSDEHGVPMVIGAPLDGAFSGNAYVGSGGLTAVVRDPQYVGHYFHFLEILIALFAFQMQYFSNLKVERLVFGSQPWNNPRQHDVQKHLVRAIYGDVQIVDGDALPTDLPGSNVLCIDRTRAFTRINKFLELLLPEVRLWAQEFRRRVHAAVDAPVRDQPRRPSDVRCSYIHREPPRTLTDPVKARLFEIMRSRFGAIGEVDFAELAWSEQVRHCAQLDVLVGVHGNGLTNLLWLPPHATAIEVFQQGFHAYDYQMMAEIAGIDYWGVEATEAGHVYRDWCRFDPPGGHINQSIDRLPEAAFEQVLEMAEAKFSAGV